nr:putative RNA-directed DNA polymerase, eukaryota, reverse transcriptase zinc-binding domain protein [Tanacetum cinerariifolium]
MDNKIRVLQVFYLASGLKFNIAKSNVYGIGVSLDEIEYMARVIGCASDTILFTYLGLSIGSNMNLISNWQLLIDRFRGELSTWKAILLSIGGRLTLIKGVNGDQKKMALIKWDNILASFEKGGLSIISLKAFNLTLLQKWRWRFVNNPDSLWAQVIKAIHEVDAGMDLKGCKSRASDIEKHERLHLLKEYDDLNKLEEMDTVQKARIKWDVEGDEYSKFFYGILKQKRHRQIVKGIMINDEWVTNPHQVKTAFLNFYKDKFQDHDSLIGLSPVSPRVRLNTNEIEVLEATVTMEEIRGSVWDCGSQKAPGLDGFSFLFIKTYWELFKYDVEAAVRIFFDSFVMSKGANSSFITLIPKILANRFVKVVDKVVSHEQSAFISGRQNLDGPIMLSKLEVLDHMLLSLGFGIKWRRWIQSCLQSARSSVLVNGSPSFEFPIKRGLRHGDPLSPFLFLIIMEGLHLALKDVVDAGLIYGSKVGDSGLNISHLFYADDVVIISKWNRQDMDNKIRVLQVFYLASGLKFNIAKSNVYGIGVSLDEIEYMARVIGCASDTILFTYLG